MNTALNVFHFHTLRLVLRYFTVSLANPIPHTYCGCTSKKCPTVNTRRDPMNHGIFLVLVSFLYLGKSDTSASPHFWSRRLPARTASPRSSLFQGAAYKTDFCSFHPIKSPVRETSPAINTVCYPQQQSPQKQRDGGRIKGSLLLYVCVFLPSAPFSTDKQTRPRIGSAEAGASLWNKKCLKSQVPLTNQE